VYRPTAGVTTKHLASGVDSHFNPTTKTTVNTGAGGHIMSVERPGLRATNFREDGRAGHIERTRPDGSKMVVNRGLHGERRVEVVRPNGVRVVTVGRQAFVERPLRAGYVSRTYVVGGRTEVRVYRTYGYRGVRYVTYVPRVYYQPAFYRWAGRPWGPSVVYGWGWAPATPWFYGAYFAPEPVYSTPSLWLTDFLLAANLRLAYDNQQQQYQDQQQQESSADASQGVAATLTPEIKLQIAGEVKQQLDAQQTAAAQPSAAALPQGTATDVPPPALKQRVFVVSTSFDVTGTDGSQSCALTAGDIIERTPGQSVTSDGKVAVNVMSSKAGDCQADFATQIDVATLQDMQNQFNAQIASGIESLASNQGKGSLPSGPAANPRRNAAGEASPDASNDAELVTKLNQEADQTEADMRNATNGGQ